MSLVVHRRTRTLLFFLSSFFLPQPVHMFQHIIKVCQNKDCCKRFGPSSTADGGLVQTFRDLLPPTVDGSSPTGSTDDAVAITIEASGCLSQCGKGPNVSVESSQDGSDGRLFFGIDCVSTAAAILDVACGFDGPEELLLAANGIAKAQKASSPSTKESILSPIIATLSSDSILGTSFAHAHALTMRADARLELIPPNVNGALEDSRTATSIAQSYGTAYRVLADAEEAAGNIAAAIDAVSKWVEANPSFAVKAKKEIARLSSLQ